MVPETLSVQELVFLVSSEPLLAGPYATILCGCPGPECGNTTTFEM
jgi:hypothetical protein